MDQHWLSKRANGGRAGFTLLEASVAAAMLAVLLAASVQVIALLHVQQQAAERRGLAVEAVQNLLEEFENLPWEQATAAAAERLTLPDGVRSSLPEAKVSLAVVDETEPVAARQATIALAWKASSGQPATAVRMTTWIFPERTASINGDF